MQRSAPPTMERLDVTGLLCPLPLLRARRRFATLRAGERLQVVGDDPAMELDFRAWAQEPGVRLLEVERDGPRVRVVVTRDE